MKVRSMNELQEPDILPENPTVLDLINLLAKYPSNTPIAAQDYGGFETSIYVYINNVDEWRKGILFIEGSDKD